MAGPDQLQSEYLAEMSKMPVGDRRGIANLQSVDAEQFAEEEAVKVADIKLLVEQRRHYLGIANALAERLGISVCVDCGRRLVK